MFLLFPVNSALFLARCAKQPSALISPTMITASPSLTSPAVSNGADRALRSPAIIKSRCLHDLRFLACLTGDNGEQSANHLDGSISAISAHHAQADVAIIATVATK